MIGLNLTGIFFYSFVTSITPGPNNYMLFAYGQSYGFSDAGKIMAGIFSGFFVMLCIAGYGIAEIITGNQLLTIILKLISSVWLLYLAFALSKLSANLAFSTSNKVGFFQAFLLQFVNPKAWIMAITGAAAFLPKIDNIHLRVFLFAIPFSVIGIPCMVVWIKSGNLIAKWLKSEMANKMLSWSLFILMLVSIVTIWIE
jgi:threonine/homoserine/homoserine lactone efflux protein